MTQAPPSTPSAGSSDDGAPSAASQPGGDNSNPSPSPQDSLVRLEKVSKSFGSLHVLKEMDLDIRRGQTTVILGPSGTGKSVLLKHIVGLLKPDRGRVFFQEQQLDTLSPPEMVEIRKQVGYLFQMGALFDSMNNEQNIAFPLVEHTDMDKDQRRAAVKRVLEMVGLDGVQKKMPADLSGGQRKRVSLARAIVLEPCLVLYDEPTTGLDPIRADVINELILALSKRLGITSVVVTHDMASANKIADRMVLLYDGQVVCDGDPETFRDSPSDRVQRFIHGQADQEDLERIRAGFDQQPSAKGPSNQENEGMRDPQNPDPDAKKRDMNNNASSSP